jgi:hypothetical protein
MNLIHILVLCCWNVLVILNGKVIKVISLRNYAVIMKKIVVYFNKINKECFGRII